MGQDGFSDDIKYSEKRKRAGCRAIAHIKRCEAEIALNTLFYGNGLDLLQRKNGALLRAP